MSGAKIAGAAAAAVGAGFFAYQQMKAAPALPPMPAGPLNNRAFVFVKPHATTEKTQDMVREQLKGKGFTVHSEGDISSKEIDEKKLIDQHYYAIASKATIMKPEDMNVPAEKFQSTFGLSWADALKDKKAMNALDCCKELGIDGDEMAKLWAGCKKAGKLVKFGGGFYCGEIVAKGKTMYVFNGFFMQMRAGFTAPGKKIHYYDVEWDAKSMSWEAFRGEFLGPTDPKDAPKDSLRGVVMRDWKKLGLAGEPNVGDNGIHASASPFEALAERMNWLGVKCNDDTYCKTLLASGIPEPLVNEWTRDPQVAINAEKSKKKSLFDSLEDQDAAACLASAKKLASYAS
jgi:nucleoside diphosphate kinase